MGYQATHGFWRIQHLLLPSLRDKLINLTHAVAFQFKVEPVHQAYANLKRNRLLGGVRAFIHVLEVCGGPKILGRQEQEREARFI